ncbi:YbaB/EbfC family nucleoid-associated protein [bacterium]|nr:YbaB/EbfC family nucleoid-associated protein [candidate division CSSED10-310 bacterium]
MKGMNIMKQAKQMMATLEKVREEMERRTMEASVGGGMVTVTARGDNQVVSVKIDPEVVDPQDVEMLQDLIQAATNEALKKVQVMMKEEMAKITGGLGIPGLF